MLIKNIQNILFLFIFYGLLFPLDTNITGQVLDKKTNNPLYKVNIYIKDKSIGTITDQNGFFNLNLRDIKENNIKLSIQIIGYEEKYLTIDPSKKSNLGKIYLSEKVIELESIIITSSNDSSRQISNIYITGTELNENIKSNIATTLNNYPNIGINSFGIVTSKPSLRGLSGDRFLLTKDGIETGDLSQSSIDHVIALDMTEVKEIEIVRGPKSLVFGPNAIGGVIKTSLIGSPKVKVDKFFKNILFGRESINNSKYGNIMLYMPFNNNQINVFYSNRETKNQTSPIGILDNTQSKTYNYKLGYTNYNNSNFINFTIERFNMEYGIPSKEPDRYPAVDILLLKNNYQIYTHEEISFFTFNKMDIKYNYIDYVHLEMIKSDKSYDNIYDILDNRDFHVSLGKVTENYKLELSGNNIVYGSEYTIKKFKPDGFYLTPTTKEKQLSFYGFNQFRINRLDTDFLTSFRIGYLYIKPGEYNFSNGNANLIAKDENDNPIEDDEGNKISLVKNREFYNLSFSFGFKKHINKFEFNSWFMHTMRPPRVEELYSDGPHLASYAFEIGNPRLKAEKIYGIENAIKYKSSPFNFSLVTFFNYSPYFFEMTKNGFCDDKDWVLGTSHPCAGQDFIDWGSGVFGWLYKYSAKGNEVILRGYEFDLGYNINNYNLKYNYSLVRGDNITINKPLSYINPIKQILSLGYKNKSTYYKIRISKINSQNRLGEFETPTAGVYLTDIIINLNFNRHNFTIQLNNIFDNLYYNHLSRIKSLTPEPGKNIHFIYKIVF